MLNNLHRYRSYYYDTETSWYYLNSRYYDPNIGRFITMDEIEYLGSTSTLLSYNLFTYCEGNPVNKVDNDGQFPIILAIVLIIADIVVTAAVISNYIDKPEPKSQLKSSKDEMDRQDIDDVVDVVHHYKEIPPSERSTGMGMVGGANNDRSAMNEDIANHFPGVYMSSINNSIENCNFFNDMFKSYGGMIDPERKIIETMMDDWGRRLL